MELKDAIELIKNPKNPYDADLNALRVVVLSLLEDESKKKSKKK